MGIVIGVICAVTALVVGVGIAAVANKSVRNFKEEQHVRYTPQHSKSSGGMISPQVASNK